MQSLLNLNKLYILLITFVRRQLTVNYHLEKLSEYTMALKWTLASFYSKTSGSMKQYMTSLNFDLKLLAIHFRTNLSVHSKALYRVV